MKEEMIINGVNVAKCGYFCETDKDCNICGMGIDGEDTFCRYCKDNSNCYYKQLKRLAQENEQLKELKDKYYIEKLDMEAQLSYCIQALEEIREIAGWHTTNKDSCDVQDDMESIIDIIDEVLKED